MLLEIRELLKGEKTGKYLSDLVKNDKMSIPEKYYNQRQKLLELIEFVTKTNIFYQKHFTDNNITIKDLQDKDLNQIISSLPVIDKSLIFKNKNFWLDKSQHTFRSTTSGSTGQPFEIFHSAKSNEIKFASKERALSRFKIGRTEKQLYYGCTYNSSKPSQIQKINSFIHNSIILNKKIIDIRFINSQNIYKEIERINKLKPVTIWGYPSFIFELARFISENKKQINNKNLKAIITSGESFSEFQRDTILKAFKVPIIDEYNSNEGFLASSCVEGKLHVNEDTCIFRILDSEGNISEYGNGQLVVTQLYSHAYPLINYIQGDIVNIDPIPCNCGIGFKVLKSVDGRSGILKIRNGNSSITHSIFSHMITKSPFFNFIERYQLVQTSNGITFKVQEKFNSKLPIIEFESFVSELFNKEKISFDYVDEIPREKSGKYKDLIIL